jgi:flagellar motor switch protein FliN/FliY
MTEEQMEKAQLAEETEKPQARPAGFSELEDDGNVGSLSLDLVLDISMPVTVELGRASMTVQELLQLGPGSVVELDKSAGEPADLFVRDVRFARGEVVVVDNNFGLRITEVVDRRGRLRQLGGVDEGS